jgi:hypothetical protein
MQDADDSGDDSADDDAIDELIDVIDDAIQEALADESVTELAISGEGYFDFGDNINDPPLLTAGAIRRVFECLQNNPDRFDTVKISHLRLSNVAALNVFRDSLLPLCKSVTTVKLYGSRLENDGLERLLPAFYNTSVTTLGS